MSYSPGSKVWIYTGDRDFSEQECSLIARELDAFCRQWAAHGRLLKARGEIRYRRIIVLIVDETTAGASGCSIDASVHFLQGIQSTYGVNLFNRLLLTWKNGPEWQTNSVHELQALWDRGMLLAGTPVINTQVKTLEELENRFEIPLAESWIFNKLKRPVHT